MKEATHCLLPDYVLAIRQLFDYLRQVAAQGGIAQAPALPRLQLLPHDLLVALALLRHADDHDQHVQRIEHDLEVLVR